MNKKRYEKFKALMTAIENLDYVSVNIDDYADYLRVNVTLTEEAK